MIPVLMSCSFNSSSGGGGGGDGDTSTRFTYDSDGADGSAGGNDVIYLTVDNLGSGSVFVDWGDGTTNTYTEYTDITHAYTPMTGTYNGEITFSGDGEGTWVLRVGGRKMVSVESFQSGIAALRLSPNTYIESNLVSVPDYLPSSVTSIGNIFTLCHLFNDSNVTAWDTSNVTDFSNTFRWSYSFNQDISGWNTGAATNMFSMFYGASTFNQDLSGWCVSGIPTAPGNFDINAENWVLPRPVWGTCP